MRNKKNEIMRNNHSSWNFGNFFSEARFYPKQRFKNFSCELRNELKNCSDHEKMLHWFQIKRNKQERQNKSFASDFQEKRWFNVWFPLFFFLCSHAQVFSAPGQFSPKRKSSGKKRNSRRKRRNFRSGRQQPCRWVKWAFMTLIVITLMLLVGIY